MAGNVWEWVNDWYYSAYYQYCVDHGIVNDPPGSASGTSRVLRGGSWINDPSYLRVAARYYTDPDIEVHGHADSTGPEEYNMGLSHRRAVAVRDFLVEHFRQLRASQFTIRDFGENEPIADNATREGRARNRRVEIKIIGSD